MNFLILGCGSLGSSVAYNISLKSLDDPEIKKIILIDDDVLTEKNNPYIIGIDFSESYLEYKSKYLENIILGINDKLVVKSFVKSYPDEITPQQINKYSDYIKIDCRDTVDESSIFDVKLNIDGNFLSVIFKPENKKGTNNSRYSLGYSKYNSSIASMIILTYIFKNDINNFNKRTNFLIDLASLNYNFLENE
jgi:hypothetical protein